MIDLIGTLRRVALASVCTAVRGGYIDQLYSNTGASATGMAITSTIHVSPDGDGTNGYTWPTAYQTIQDALDNCPTDANECTLILVAPHTTYYDINTTGDPTWSCNVEIRGTHRLWTVVRNTHGTATSILKLTGKASLVNLVFLQTGTLNGVIFTKTGYRVRKCAFSSSGLTGAATSLHIDGSAALILGGRVEDVEFNGHATWTTAMYFDKASTNDNKSIHIHTCLNGVQIVDATSTKNDFDDMDIGECAIGLNIDAGSEQHFRDINFHHNTVNVDDEVCDHIWDDIKGDLPITIYPDDLTGITLAADAAANVWGTNTSIRAAGVALKPFRVLSVICQPVVAQLHHLRLSQDAGTHHFDQISIESSRGVANPAPVGTGYIFNCDTPISGSIKAFSAGSDEMQVWLKIQEI